MKSYRYNGEGSVVCEELPDPVAKGGEVLVRVRATSLNHRDLMIAEGRYYSTPRADVIPLSDGAGEVVAVGEGVTRVKPGDRIAGTFFADWVGGPMTRAHGASQRGSAEDGFLATFRAIRDDSFVRIPDYLSFEEAATLPCAALTAWTTLTGGRGVRAGDTVLTLGTGGVSLFAVQIARALGARVISTTSSEAKAERLKALGADTVVNYAETPDWHRAVREATGGEGVDFVVEVAGGASLSKSILSSAVGGEIGMIGGVAGGVRNLDLTILGSAVVTLRRIAVGSRVDFEAMNRALAACELRPVIDSVFGFDEAPDAFAHLATGAHMGKVVISHG